MTTELQSTKDAAPHTGDEELNRIVGDETRTLGRIQRHLSTRTVAKKEETIDYEAELLSLRNQIQEARLEDVPPLIEEMERLTEVAARRGKVTEGAINADSPYFGHLVLEENEKKREVLIGKATYLEPKTGVRIVDWRDAPVSRIYYRYDEGDEYDENFGGRDTHGEVVTRRSVAIAGGVLRRVGCPQGIFMRTVDGDWRRAGDSAKLHGGQGAAMRPEGHHSPGVQPEGTPGRLGIGLDDGREEKFLPEITALIDPRQFELITKADAGLVVIQGGAGSGKTTIGLHRLAYLAFHDPKRFRGDKMLVLVYNDALVRYISKVLPSLGAAGTPVATFERWAAKLRANHLRGLPEVYFEDTPGAVTRVKKHPLMLRAIDTYAKEMAERVEATLVETLAALPEVESEKQEVLAFYRANDKAPLAVRLQRLVRWVSPERDPDADLMALAEGKAPPPPPRSLTLRHAVERVVSRSRRESVDVTAAWSEILTDRARLERALADGEGPALELEDIATAVRWASEKCALVIGEVEARREGDAEEKASKKDKKDKGDDAEDPSLRVVDDEKPKKLVARRKSDDEDDDGEDDDRSVGIDGERESEPAMLDREDDAILLRLIQRLRGPLVKGSPKTSSERLRYEHILIDEAQDLSPVELAVVVGTATKERSITMAGDVAQRLHMDNGFTDWQSLLRAISRKGADEPIEVEPLKVQYRSTHPIIELAQSVLGPLAQPGQNHAIRGGAPVELFQFTHSGECVAFLGEALRELMQKEPRASVAVIARYVEQADLYYRGLVTAEVPNLRRIADQDFPFRAGIDVTDVKQVKGLEFDYVVLLEASSAVYPVNDESRHLLHIAATRAAHQLWLTTSGPASLLLPESLRTRAF